MKRLIILFLLILPLTQAATIHGSVYNSDFSLEKDVIIQINTQPLQKQVTKDGTYLFEVDTGEYILQAKKGSLETEEKITIVKDGSFVYDVFLLPSFLEEDEIWLETNEDYFAEEKSNTLQYWVAGIIFLAAGLRILYYRRKYGPLRKFRKNIKKESKKSIEEHKADLQNEPGLPEKVLEILEKHDGRISQKALRKELLYLSEAKVSLLLTELEHKGKIEKVKKGRGNVILLR